MILSDSAILKRIKRGHIVIQPFRPECLGSNSYDVHLGRQMATYHFDSTRYSYLDAKLENPVNYFDIPDTGLVLVPGKLYLGVTEEYTETMKDMVILDGKSSVGRLGILIHLTAGKGDVGFKGHWTLEIAVQERVKIYAGMPIGQLIYYKITGRVINPYDKKADSKYADQPALPVPSAMYKNFK